MGKAFFPRPLLPSLCFLFSLLSDIPRARSVSALSFRTHTRAHPARYSILCVRLLVLLKGHVEKLENGVLNMGMEDGFSIGMRCLGDAPSYQGTKQEAPPRNGILCRHVDICVPCPGAAPLFRAPNPQLGVFSRLAFARGSWPWVVRHCYLGRVA